MTLFSNNWFLASFSATLISASYWPSMPSWSWLVIMTVAIVFILVCKMYHYFLGIALAISVAILAGNFLQWQVKTLFQTGMNITINGVVDSPFKKISHGYEGVLTVNRINDQPLMWLARSKVRLIAPYPLKQEDVLFAHVTLKPIYGLANEVGFDAERFAISQGIIARATVDTSQSWYRIDTASPRQRLVDKAQAALEGMTHSGYLMALSFGLRDTIADWQWKALKQSGLIHLLSISGLHIGMAFGVGYWLGHWLRLGRLRVIWLPMGLALALSWSYAWLAGFTIPTQRAVIFCTIAVLLHFSAVALSRWTLLLAVLALCLFLTPFAALSSSLWLSFFAVGCVYLAMAPFSVHDSTWSKVKRLLVSQSLLLVLLAPVTSYFFGGFSVAALVYNLIFVPWFTIVVVPLIFAALAFTGISVIAPATLFWQAADWALYPLTLSLPYAELGWWRVSSQQTLLCLLIAFAVAFRDVLRWPVSLLFISSISLFGLLSHSERATRVDVLDVGHGLAVLIEKQGRALLYDTGKAWPGGSIAEQLIEPVLVRRGIRTLDGLMISHQDNDHSGGAGYLEQAMLPEWVMGSHIESQTPCIKGKAFQWQRLYFEVLWPPKQVKRARNPHSCVIRMVDKENQFSLLMTGDIDALAEWILVREPEKLASDVVLVPHHGSATSSVPAFVASVDAELAIASLAKGNQWNMPKPEVVATYLQHGTRWLDTGEAGQITLWIDNGHWQVSSMRRDSFTAWYRQMLRNQVE